MRSDERRTGGLSRQKEGDMKRVTFRTDHLSYSGTSVTRVVEAMMADSHDLTSDPQVYMTKVAHRALQMYGTPIKTTSAVEFLRDLEALGEGHLIKTIL
jgi:cyclophilin family peptidyl-prolyl cis-trans isomerase